MFSNEEFFTSLNFILSLLYFTAVAHVRQNILMKDMFTLFSSFVSDLHFNEPLVDGVEIFSPMLDSFRRRKFTVGNLVCIS